MLFKAIIEPGAAELAGQYDNIVLFANLNNCFAYFIDLPERLPQPGFCLACMARCGLRWAGAK
eukprot:5641419-Pleurochrysis_carterae.AAC.1